MNIYLKSFVFNFILNNNILNTNELKYKTIQKTKEQVHHYGCNNIHLYTIGLYKLNNGIQISFDYCYEMD